VPRLRLVELLDRSAIDARLTLVSAPAGFGKSVLLSSWRRELGARAGRIAWVPATADAEPSSFWTRAAAAVAAASGSGGPGADESPLAAVSRLVEEAGRPLVVVVDEFDELAPETAADPLERLLRRGPAGLRVVLATRRDPDLALHRLRLAGELAEIRARDLAFTEPEAEALFAAAGIELDPGQVRTLVRRTQGWAAALRFSALSLRERDRVESFVSSFARTERAVSDYLLREVLAAQPAARRDFLLRTSACDRLTAELADAVTGRADGAAALASLEQENVFVDVEPDPGWYRYHPLFLELLRTEAPHVLGPALADVHRSAAGWLAARGDSLAALRHAVAAGDAPLAGRLLAGSWVELVARGDSRAAAELAGRLPAAAIRADPHLCLLAAWQRVAAGDPAEAAAWLALADRAAAPLEAEAAAQYASGRDAVELLRARRACDADGLERAAAGLVRPEALLQPSRAAEVRRTLALCARAALATWRGELDEAAPLLEAALDASRRLELRDCELDALALLALACAVRGELKRADRLGRLAVELADQEPGRAPGAQRACALAARALAAFEWDDLDAASSLAGAARDEADAAGDRLARLAATAASAACFGRQGVEDVERARLELAGVSAELAPPLLAPRLLVLRARIALAAGDGAAAAALVGGDGAARSGELAVAAARVGLAGRDPAAAVQALESVLAGDRPAVFGRTRVEAAVLRAVAATQAADADGARRWIERALALAEPEGLRAPFFEAGAAVVELLRDTIRFGTAHRWLAGSLLAAFGGRDVGRGMAELLQPLSDKEQVVLRYLPTMMSNQEIAGELYVSVNTIKTHLKNIYRKLGSSDRREAVRRARELRLIG
jgi:LuxR family maltose regulon positive regulatory protein